MAKKNWMGMLQKLDGALVDRTDPFQHVLRSHSPSLNFCFGEGWGLPRGYSIIVYGPPNTKLLPFLGAEARLAHGGVTKENKTGLPEAYWKSDPVQLVEQFNNEEFPILVGTSCISTGTNVKANEVTINLTGGKSEIQVWQGPKGRSTRLFTFKSGRKKTACRVIDFDVVNSPTVHRHTEERVRIYKESGPLQEVA